MTLVSVKWQGNNQAWFTTNAAVVYPANITIYCNEDPNYGQYKYTDGVTILSALPFLGGGGGGGQVATVVGTANRITVDETDPANPIVNIASQYDAAITNEIAAAVAAKKNTVPLIHSVGFNSVNPADNTHYYFGILGVAASSAPANTAIHIREYGCPATGTITSMTLSLRLANGSTCSNEVSTLYLKNTTTGTLHTISNAISYDTAFGDAGVFEKSYNITGLSIAVTAGDELMSIIGAPAWATNPTTVYWNAYYLIEI